MSRNPDISKASTAQLEDWVRDGIAWWINDNGRGDKALTELARRAKKAARTGEDLSPKKGTESLPVRWQP